MLVRIVKLSFNEEHIETFLENFETQKNDIRNFEGCRLLELYQDKENSSIFFTYSYWTSDEALNNYRNSDFFKGVWAQTKVFFNAKPEAWSINKLASLH